MKLFMWHNLIVPDGKCSLIAFAENKDQAKELILLNVRNRQFKSLVREHLNSTACLNYTDPTAFTITELTDVEM